MSKFKMPFLNKNKTKHVFRELPFCFVKGYDFSSVHFENLKLVKMLCFF